VENWELANLHFLEKKQSSIPGAGFGLFATASFAKFTPILRYGGVHLGMKEVRQLYDPDEGDNARKNKDGWRYVIELDKKHFIDASDPNRSNAARYINHNVYSLANCEFNKYGTVQTKRRIYAGEELFINYCNKFTNGLKRDGFTMPMKEEYALVRQQLREKFRERLLQHCLTAKHSANTQTTLPAAAQLPLSQSQL
jgi:SET domain-containing protein